MTVSSLLALILAALFVQLCVGIGIAVRSRRADAGTRSAATSLEARSASFGAWSGWREFRVVRRVFEDAAQSQCSLHLEPVDGAPLPPFEPGQFLTFSLPVSEAAGEGAVRTITRCYSLSDRPHPQGYRVTIKRVLAPADRPDLPPGASSNHLHDRVREGDVLRVKAPSGRFVLDPDSTVPTVLIAGGIGITPMLSMLLWSLPEQPERTIHLYLGLRHGGEHAFEQVLRDLASAHPSFHLNVIYSRPRPGDVPGRDFQHAGHVDIELLRKTLPHGRHRFYVCGPAPMMQSMVPALHAWGARSEDVHYEAFGPASVRSLDAPATEPGEGPPVEVRFERAGRTLLWDGRDATLLDFAERHGIEIDSGCRSGSCGSCETELVSGDVHYTSAPDHDVAAGHCLPCVCTPTSAVVVGV